MLVLIKMLIVNLLNIVIHYKYKLNQISVTPKIPFNIHFLHVLH